MRIALYHNLPSGGAKRTLYEEAHRLAYDHHVDVFTLSTANFKFADLRSCVNNHQIFDFQPRTLLNSPFGRLNQVIRLADLRRLRPVLLNVAQAIDQGNYDVCLAHPCQFESSPSILRYLQHTPSVYYCHEPLRRLYEEMPPRPYEDTASTLPSVLDRIDPLIALYQRGQKRVDRNNLRSAQKVIVNSQFIQTAVKDIYQKDSQVCYHGVDTDWYKPLPIEKEGFILSVGSLTHLKGFDFLIKSIAMIPDGQRPALVIASNFQDPREKNFLEQLASEKKVNLNLEKNITDERLLQLYNQASITAYAAIREPFGLVPVESMACGTPVVAVKDGGVKESIMDEHTGFLVDRQPEQFSHALMRVLSEPSLAEEFSKNARRHVETNWSWDQALERLENHLEAARKNQR